MRQIRTNSGRSIASSKRRAAQPHRHLSHEDRQSLIYSTRKWRTVRKMIRDQWNTCVGCRTAAAAVVDHIRPVQVHPAGAFDPRNLQPLCRACHDAKTKRIDAPAGNPANYRSDLSHEADMRPEAMRRWADDLVASGLAARMIGDFALGSGKLNTLKDWTPSV